MHGETVSQEQNQERQWCGTPSGCKAVSAVEAEVSAGNHTYFSLSKTRRLHKHPVSSSGCAPRCNVGKLMGLYRTQSCGQWEMDLGTVTSMDAIESSLCKIWKNPPRMFNFLRYSKICFHFLTELERISVRAGDTAQQRIICLVLCAALGSTKNNNHD